MSACYRFYPTFYFIRFLSYYTIIKKPDEKQYLKFPQIISPRSQIENSIITVSEKKKTRAYSLVPVFQIINLKPVFIILLL